MELIFGEAIQRKKEIISVNFLKFSFIMIQDLKDFAGAISWQITTIILTLILRKNVLLLLSAITAKINRPGKMSLSKDGLSIEEYIDVKQKEILEIISNLPMLQKLLSYSKSLKLGQEPQVEVEKRADMHGRTYEETTDDPIKVTWADIPGPVANNRQLKAEVIEIPGSNFYKLKLTVQSTDPADPLTGYAKFYLHPTFVNTEPIVPVVNGIATLNLMSYGSFTFGVETDNGQRKVKMDLATDVVGVSQKFKES